MVAVTVGVRVFCAEHFGTLGADATVTLGGQETS
jgi:hypothetical protein